MVLGSQRRHGEFQKTVNSVVRPQGLQEAVDWIRIGVRERVFKLAVAKNRIEIGCEAYSGKPASACRRLWLIAKVDPGVRIVSDEGADDRLLRFASEMDAESKLLLMNGIHES